ncbi:photosystem II 5 kDa protein, chloroplastic [Carica papaya]|uniref:photosystem II 5 kDa protein, chloroplastic n=1 Tax=Carica papaya TaxID=3649 RepID=UPI000B8CCAC9|nr:photosystem II 5 kDa protein, chloroplastic [Carica papaya]
MASVTMAASFLPSSPSTIAKLPSTTANRGLVLIKASSEKTSLELKNEVKEESSRGRRDLVFAGAAAAVCSIAKVAMADEPKRGTPEAKKKYAPICVTMPTAKICHK